MNILFYIPIAFMCGLFSDIALRRRSKLRVAVAISGMIITFAATLIGREMRLLEREMYSYPCGMVDAEAMLDGMSALSSLTDNTGVDSTDVRFDDNMLQCGDQIHSYVIVEASAYGLVYKHPKIRILSLTPIEKYERQKPISILL